jgi:hypothetical protein
VQLRHHTSLTSEEYVSEEAWQQASLEVCPRHPQGGCGLSRHGSYARVEPSGMRVARWYCPLAQESFSLLPDCLAARVRGSLDEVESACVLAEQVGVEQAARELRPEVELPGVLRWLRRRRRGVRAALLALVTLLPGQLGAQAELGAVRAVLGSERALVLLREMGAEHLDALPRPLGFGRGLQRRSVGGQTTQHETGPDPPDQTRY